MILRPYQKEAVASVWEYFTHHDGNPILALPTGTGKSLISAELLRQAFAAWPEQRILLLTHVKELLEQNFEKLLKLWPTAPAGIYSAGLKRRDHQTQIVMAGIASVAKKAQLFGKVDLVLVDECHLISPKSATMYGQFLAALKEVNPLLKVVGLTATAYRLGLGHLTEGSLFTDVCYDLTSRDAFNRLVADGYLAPLVTKRTYSELDVSGVHLSGGEYVLKELQHAVDRDAVTEAAVQEMVHYGKDRKHWLVFASGVEHSEHVAECLQAHGVTAVALHSEISSEERASILADFKSGKIQAVTNNNILTTGFDHPGIDMIGVLRPTQSTGLWVQMLGRGTRPCAGKTNCLVLDFAGNTRRLGPINDPVLPRKKGEKGPGQAPVRVCEVCLTYNFASARVCVECGAEFPREHKLATTAYTDEVMASSAPVVEVFKVDHMSYAVHQKPGRPPSLKATYYCGLRIFNEWVCFEHEGYAKHKAHEWWKERSAEAPPETSEEAKTQAPALRVPKTISVWINTKYPEVKGYGF